MRLYFENPVGRVLEHPHGYALVQYAEGPRDFATFQALLTHTHQLLRRHGWHKILADQRYITTFTAEEQQWVANYWLERSAQDGYELYGAVLVSGERLAHLPPDALADTLHQQSALRYRLFATEDEATAWLLQLP
ncbi:hypothetical protein [Hymenobacter rubidus]|uniref:hypothetical protein n=1 Tax=Hymenobacter rubidus TaxID=1441626 RepID=UPI00191DAD25|nr:hypothetical protein [Hymenobacter rubidus]